MQNNAAFDTINPEIVKFYSNKLILDKLSSVTYQRLPKWTLYQKALNIVLYQPKHLNPPISCSQPGFIEFSTKSEERGVFVLGFWEPSLSLGERPPLSLGCHGNRVLLAPHSGSSDTYCSVSERCVPKTIYLCL